MIIYKDTETFHLLLLFIEDTITFLSYIPLKDHSGPQAIDNIAKHWANSSD